jgi:peptidyl-prolyl cis-trans isomerase D
MFDFFRQHTRVLQFVLLLLILPSFVFLGVQGYSDSSESSSTTVATVAGKIVSKAQWEAAQKEQIERIRQQMPDVDARIFDTPEMKRQSLDAVIRERVMFAAADQLHLVASDTRLQRVFSTDQQFAFMRNPDGSLNKDVLSAQGISSDVFAQRLRQDLTLRQVMLGVAGTAIAPAQAASAALDAMFQQREVQVQNFATQAARNQVSPTDADIEKYYQNPANAAQFQAPEQASVEYVVLDLESLKKNISFSQDELRKHYTENIASYIAPEERRASHILIKAEKNIPQKERDAAQQRAESLLAEAQKNPSVFAELARKNSQDSGSATNGGDLDFFGRNAMVKPFEDAAFALKPGELSKVIATDFGFHIIKLTAIRGGETRDFAVVRADIEAALKTQLAQKRYSELATEFTNMVYEQPEAIKPVADKFKLELRTAQNVKRQPASGASGALANSKFLEALFSAEAVSSKRNIEAVELAPNTLASGRVVEHAPANQLPLAQVKNTVKEKLITLQAAALARKQGEERLAALRAAPSTVFTETPQIVSRAQARDVPPALLTAVLKAPAASLPGFIGVDLGEQGYAVAKITKVLGRDPAVGDTARGQAQYTQAWGDAELQAYYAALKTRYKVEIKPNALAPLEPQDSAARSSAGN